MSDHHVNADADDRREPQSASEDDAPVTLTASSPRYTLDGDGDEPPTVPEVAPGTMIAGRYRIEARVGIGGAGVVYRAVDRETDELVAIKLLRPDRLADRRAQLRFRRELRAIARLEHPGCVAVRASGHDGPHPYLVMEYAAGGDLGRLVGAPLSTLVPILVKLAYALDYVHGRRIVHRDLKPANVLLTDDDPPEPKLADFGIAAMQSGAASAASTDAPGTIDYMSPEQVRGERVDPRSDLYAFGCMIFRLCARRPLFEGNAYGRLVARLAQPAPDLAGACEVPPALARITARLLARDPDARYQSALDLAQDLGEVAAGADPGPIAGAPARSAFLFEPGLVGRGSIQAALVARIEEVVRGERPPELIALIAPAGVGKSTLADAIRRHQLVRGRHTVNVQVEAGGRAPFAPFPALEAAFIDAEAAGPLAGDGAPTARSEAEPWVTGLRARIDRLAATIRRLAAVRPVVIVIDDLHLADPGALALLGELVTTLGEGPSVAGVGLLATLRPAGAAAIEALAGRAPAHLVELPPLTAEDAERVVAGMLGLAVADLPPGLAASLHRSSRGNPLLLRSDVQMLTESGALRRVRGGWAFASTGRAREFLGTELLQARLDALSTPTRSILAHAAVCGLRFDSALLVDAFAIPEVEVLDAIDEALRAEVIASDERGDGGLDVYVFAHARLCEVLYEGGDARERPRRHARLAAALTLRAGTPLAVLAHHLARSDERAAAHRALVAAGEEALAAFAFDAAIHLFEEALERVDALPEGEQEGARGRCHERLADGRVALGRAPDAVRLLEALVAAPAQAPIDRARRLRKLGLARLRTARGSTGVAALEQALEVLGDHRPRSRAGIFAAIACATLALVLLRFGRRRPDDLALRERAICHRELGFMYRWLNAERAFAHLAATVRLAERIGDPELRVDGYSHTAMGFAFMGMPILADRFERAARALAIRARDRIGEARVEVLSGAIDTLARGDEAAARDHFDRAGALASTIGDRFLTDFVRASRGWCMSMCGHFGEARLDLDDALAAASALDHDWLRADANAGCMVLDVVAGRLDEARARALALASPDVAVPMPALGALGTEGLGMIAFQEGRFREAIGFYERARRHYVDHRLIAGWGYLIEIEHIEALLCLVDVDGREAAPDLLRELRRLARQASRRLRRMPLYRGCDDLLRGVIAARSGRAAAARRLFARAIARRPAPPAYFDTWLWVRAAIERLHLGDPRDAITAELDRVGAFYEQLGAHGFGRWLAGMRRHLAV